jgi:hypothetical protein
MFKEENGAVSMRRVLAFFLVIAAIGLFVGGFMLTKREGWYVFLPGIACLVVSLFLLFFTTWSDVAAVAGALKK